MANLTAQQAKVLADDFLSLARSIEEYGDVHYHILSSEEAEKLKELHRKALDYTNKLYTLSATLVMDEVEGTLATIGNITTKIKSDYKHVQQVQKAINIAASIINLGASIAAKDPQGIAKSVEGLIKTWKE